MKLNNKQKQLEKQKEVEELLPVKYKQCVGDQLCCKKFKPLEDFSPSALKCICKECSRNIIYRNRLEKINSDEKFYFKEKIRTHLYRVDIFDLLRCTEDFFYEWIKYQSVDSFNEHFDHVLPISYFKQFSNSSMITYLRDSWINIAPIDKHANLSKGTKVDFNAFQQQLIKAEVFIMTRYKYDYELLNYLNFIKYIYSITSNKTDGHYNQCIFHNKLHMVL